MENPERRIKLEVRDGFVSTGKNYLSFFLRKHGTIAPRRKEIMFLCLLTKLLQESRPDPNTSSSSLPVSDGT
jgi:hypothetical protein